MSLPGQFDTRVLVGTVNQRPVLPGLFKQLFFNRRTPLPTKFAELHVILQGKKIIPFVTDYEGGTLVEKTRREARTVKTPRIRPKERFSAPELLDTVTGRPPYLSPDQSLDEIIEEKLAIDLDNLKDRCEVTIEYMAGRALTGGLTVAQDNIAFQIDFLMPSAHKVVLTLADLWTHADSDPLEDFEAWADLILNATGLGANTCVLGTNAWKAFRKHAKVKGELDNRRTELGHLSPRVAKNYKGSIGGLDIYAYGGSYTDGAGSAQSVLHPDYLVLGSTDAETEILFGLPEDLEAMGMQMEYFAKSWLEKDPSVLWLLVESRPLPWLKQPDGFVYAKVI